MGDFTADRARPASPFADAQAEFAAQGQMLALDPPAAERDRRRRRRHRDSGPLRHRYGAPRDLVIGVQLALADGTRRARPAAR